MSNKIIRKETSDTPKEKSFKADGRHMRVANIMVNSPCGMWQIGHWPFKNRCHLEECQW